MIYKDPYEAIRFVVFGYLKSGNLEPTSDEVWSDVKKEIGCVDISDLAKRKLKWVVFNCIEILHCELEIKTSLGYEMDQFVHELERMAA